MGLPLPPDSWVCREEGGRTLITGFDFSPVWPLVALQVMVPACFAGLTAGRVLGSFLVMAAVGVAALLRGFRLEIGPRGFVLSKTWAGVPYSQTILPVHARVQLRADFEDDTDVVVISDPDADDEITFGSSRMADGLRAAAVSARERWSPRPPPYR